MLQHAFQSSNCLVDSLTGVQGGLWMVWMMRGARAARKLGCARGMIAVFLLVLFLQPSESTKAHQARE